MYMMYNKYMNNICPSCSYTWDSRVSKPKACPYCKRYIKRVGGGLSQFSTAKKISEEITYEPID